MLKKILLAALVGIAGAGLLSAKVIKAPIYEFRKNGIMKVTEVDRAKDATRLTFKVNYTPNGWIQVAPEEIAITLPGDTAQILPLKVEGDLSFGEKYVIPESGEAVFTATYPALPKSAKKIDIGVKNDWVSIYGLDLTGKKKPAKDNATVTPTPYRPIETIFATDTITISGKIKGYDPRMGINVMELVINDEAIGHTLPTAIPVKPDGSFSRRFFLPMAQTPTFKVKDYRMCFNVYLEPGNDLEVLIDYDKLLESKVNAATFGGSLGALNNELIACPVEISSISYTIPKDKTPDEAKRMIFDHHAAKAAEIETYIADNNVSPKAAALLRNSALSTRTRDLFDYADYKHTGPLLPETFYTDFLKDAFSADSTLLACDAYFLLNRLGFSDVLPQRRIKFNVAEYRRLLDHLAQMGVEYNDEEKQWVHKFAGPQVTDSVQYGNQMDAIYLSNSFVKAGARVGKEDEVRHLIFESEDFDPFSKETESNADFIRRIAGTEELPLLWQFAVTAREGRNNAAHILPVITSDYGITNQYLIDRIAEAAKPKDGAWKLPPTQAGYVMRQLIEPYRGKYLLVDFWDITCGPCRAGIEGNKERRERHRGNPGFAILFLASEKGSPLNRYNEYVEKNLKGENVKRLPEEQMVLLRELFEFNGIPRYILFNPEGEVMNSNYETWEFWRLLKQKGIIDDSDID